MSSREALKDPKGWELDAVPFQRSEKIEVLGCRASNNINFYCMLLFFMTLLKILIQDFEQSLIESIHLTVASSFSFKSIRWAIAHGSHAASPSRSLQGPARFV
ncbi:hypothetical protein FRB95_002817 [Tulasnella sp. JGI-2019a]|nr:hypothetical protein FRB95_002817 [Tulasnella sp. JGI-2019a]